MTGIVCMLRNTRRFKVLLAIIMCSIRNSHKNKGGKLCFTSLFSSNRFLLSYERHIKGEEYKPLPISERRRLKNKVNRNSVSDAETSEGTSGSDNSTPMPHSLPPTQFISDSGTGENKVTSFLMLLKLRTFTLFF